MSKPCSNCGTALDDSFEYCPTCSQKTQLHRLHLHDIAHDAVHYFTHADKGFFQLLKALLIKTGTVAKEFVGGKRKKYFPPLNFYLLVAAIYVLMINLLASHTPVNVSKDHPEISNIRDTTQRAQVLHIYERQGRALHFMNKYSNVIAMVAVPLISFIFWLFYIRGKYNYTEHLIACMYMAGFTNLFYVLVFVPATVLAGIKSSNNSLWVLSIFVIFQIFYNSVFYYKFLNHGTPSSLLKAVGISAFTVLFWFALSGFSVGLYIANGFWGLVK